MTDKVYHSFGRTYRSRAAATAIQYAGGSEGWVVPSTERLMEDPEGDLATGSLNAFAESHSSSSFDVTIDTGEALVGGAYLARDTTTTITLDSSTSGQTVYVGWRDSQTDEVIIGKSGVFESPDSRLPIWTFDTDGSGVTSATNERNLDDYRIDSSDVEATKNFAEGDIFENYPISAVDIDDGEGSGLDADTLHGVSPDTYRGVTHIQTSEPAYNESDTWLNPDTGVYYAAYNGDWRPIPPVTVTEEAVDFTESGVTISHNSTRVNSGSIQLGGDPTGNVTDRPDDNRSSSTSNTRGIIINPNRDFDGVRVTLSSNVSNPSTAYVDDSNGNEITSEPVEGNEIDLFAPLSSGTDYRVVVEVDGYGYYDSASYPYTGTDMDIVAGAYGDTSSSSSSAYNVLSVEGLDDATSGDATISWPNPDDIKSWDLATFQRTLDNETVTVDVLDGSDNVLFSDISQNFDISTVDETTDVKIRTNLSRDNTDNNPTLDYAARRFVR